MLFRWKKRDEGFEWHKYVRTTIKLRREARRDKAEKLGRKAAESARAAGVAAEALARKGAGGARAAGLAAGDLARNSARGLGAASLEGARHAGMAAAHAAAMAARVLAQAWRRLGSALAPLLDVLERPTIAASLLLGGLIAAVAGLGRSLLAPAGVDSQVEVALVLAAAALAAALAPACWRGSGALPAWLAKPVGAMPATARRLLAAAAGLGVAAMAALAVAPHIDRWPSVSTLATGALGGNRSLSGRATALAADRLQLAGTTIRLAGIEVPEPGQQCQRTLAKGGTRSFACGDDAREAMRRLVRAGSVTCDVSSADANGIASGHCRNRTGDLAEAMVSGGHAFAESGFVSAYRSAEGAARSARAGLWSGVEPERPAAWRDRLWAAAKAEAPGGCPIKGRIRSGERSYILPWAPDYRRIRLRTSRGERWFCSEADAVAAGWKPARLE